MKRIALVLACLLAVVFVTKADAASISRITISPTTVVGGNSVTANVFLASNAPSGGEVVHLTSNTIYAIVPSTITVPAGTNSASFKISTGRVSTQKVARISAALDSKTVEASFAIDPVALSAVSFSPTLITNTTSGTGTVKLNGRAGSAITVSLSSGSSLLTVPNSVTIPTGQSQATFTATARTASGATPVTVTATYNGTSKTGTVTVSPQEIKSVTASSTMTGGTTATGKVTLNGLAASGGATVTLQSSDAATLSVPASLVIPAGASTANFTITTQHVNASRSVTLTATYLSVSKSAAVTVKPVAVASLTANPSQVVATKTGEITVKLSGPAPTGGITVALQSGASALQVPSSVVVPAGATDAVFTVSARLIQQELIVPVTATFDGASKSANVTVLPISVQGLTLSKANTGGVETFLGLTLSAPAPSGGLVVTLVSSNSSLIGLPPTVGFDEGRATAVIYFTPSVVSVDTSVTISATLNGYTKSSNTKVSVPQLLAVGYTFDTYTGGMTVPMTVMLNGPAPSAGVWVNLSSSVSSPSGATSPVTMPTQVKVLSGQRQAVVNVSTMPVSTKTTVNLTGVYNGKTLSTRVTINPVVFVDFLPGPIAVSAGGTAKITIRLNGQAPAGGIVATLSSSKTTVATVPATATIPAGSSSVTVNVSGVSNAATNATATIRVTVLGVSQEATAIITSIRLDSIYVNPSSATGGTTLSGTISLTGGAPSGGASVAVTSNHAGIVSPGNIVISSGSTSATFSITTKPVSTESEVVITAVFNGIQKSATVTLLPIYPVSITLSKTEIEGTDTAQATVTLSSAAPSGGATLTVTSSSSKAVVPATVTVAAGSTTANFAIQGVAVSSTTTVTLTVAVGSISVSNSELSVMPPKVTQLTLATSPVIGGESTVGTVKLSSAAPNGGMTVNLSSSNGNVTVPATVSVATAGRTATFTVSTVGVATTTTATVTASAGGASASASLTVDPPALTGVSVNDADLEGGFANATGTVTLNGPAPSGGLAVSLSSSGSAAGVPASVTIAQGSTSATFAITSTLVAADVNATVTATLGSNQFSTVVTVRAITLSSVTLSSANVGGGGTLTGTATINRSVPAGSVSISLSVAGPASVAASVSVAAGSTSATFTVTTAAVASDTTLTVTGAFNDVSKSATATVKPASLQAVSVNPQTIVGGAQTATGTVTLDGVAPAGGLQITLSSSNPSVASVPATVTVAANQTSATFTVSSTAVGAETAVTITASRASQSTTTTVTVTRLTPTALTLSAGAVTGGTSLTGTITLNRAATTGGFAVALSSDNAAASVPASVTVPAGQSSVNFTVTTTAVAADVSSTITGTANGVSQSASVTVQGPRLNAVTVSVATVPGGTGLTTTVTLTSAAPAGGAVVTMSPSNSAGSVANITVPAGAASATGPISTTPVAADRTVTITASYGGVSSTAQFIVLNPELVSVSVSPGSVRGDNPVTGTVTISSPAPSGGVIVTITDNHGNVTAPATVTIPAGATSATFTIPTTRPSANSTTVTVTTTYDGVTRTTTFTLTKN